MKTDEQQSLEEYFQNLCSDCLALAMSEYLHRATHHELRALKARIYLLLEGPCKTEDCNED